MWQDLGEKPDPYASIPSSELYARLLLAFVLDDVCRVDAWFSGPELSMGGIKICKSCDPRKELLLQEDLSSSRKSSGRKTSTLAGTPLAGTPLAGRPLDPRSGVLPEDSDMISRIQPGYVFSYLKNSGTIRSLSDDKIPEDRGEYFARDTRCRRIFVRICSSPQPNPSINTQVVEKISLSSSPDDRDPKLSTSRHLNVTLRLGKIDYINWRRLRIFTRICSSPSPSPSINTHVCSILLHIHKGISSLLCVHACCLYIFSTIRADLSIGWASSATLPTFSDQCLWLQVVEKISPSSSPTTEFLSSLHPDISIWRQLSD
ncbi:hypothetical protein F511_40198 [Dorcoceras hygrometricum]|uniref:Uncharacterized protein n=1 Tax=Dorcoceras hygrometricum TaxID=472368 RepID=A0A2Z7AZR8_9LAMI|nr:hypothetical protein F511_40198 [Dorcoceras hygrometricum]